VVVAVEQVVQVLMVVVEQAVLVATVQHLLFLGHQ
jgi:hypothetical protein